VGNDHDIAAAVSTKRLDRHQQAVADVRALAGVAQQRPRPAEPVGQEARRQAQHDGVPERSEREDLCDRQEQHEQQKHEGRQDRHDRLEADPADDRPAAAQLVLLDPLDDAPDAALLAEPADHRCK
jgi:hypothetical protein